MTEPHVHNAACDKSDPRGPQLYTPETGAIREAYLMWCADTDVRFDADRSLAEFDRWFIREIEAAEYSGYLRAKEESK